MKKYPFGKQQTGFFKPGGKNQITKSPTTQISNKK